jgi:ribosomal subunit interface protein
MALPDELCRVRRGDADIDEAVWQSSCSGRRPVQIPLQISFRNMTSSEAVEARIRDRADDLDRFYDRITSCRVMVEAPHRHNHQGRLFHVRIDLTVPGEEIVIKRDPHAHHAHEDVYVAIRDAFDAARRRLEDHVRRFRGDRKSHEAPSIGTVTRLLTWEGYGFLTSGEEGEVYFDRHSVVGDGFDRLKIGDEVRYVVHPGEGEKGPQASTVTPIGKHHPR